MLDTNHYKNSSCAFAEQIVAYLYDEAGDQEKTEFKAHLTNCDNCADELSAFGFVRSSVQQWRTEEFSPMQTPTMAIPFEKSVEIAANKTEKHSWLTDLRRFFTISPMQTATAALAILAVCVGLTLFIYNFSGKTEVAENNDRPVKEAVSKQTEQTKNPATEEIARENAANKLPESSENAKFPPNFEIPPEVALKNPVEKVSNNLKRTTKNPAVAQNIRHSPAPVGKPGNIESISNSMAAKNVEAPKLTTFEEVEDNSLRLSDLISEVGDK